MFFLFKVKGANKSLLEAFKIKEKVFSRMENPAKANKKIKYQNSKDKASLKNNFKYEEVHSECFHSDES